MTEHVNRPTSMADYVAILNRRKWVILLPMIAAALMAFLISSSKTSMYRASAQVLVDRTQIVPPGISGISDPCLGDPTRCLETLAKSAKQPELLRRVAAQIPGFNPDEVSVDPSADSDFLTVSATNRSPATATRVANVFAREFSQFTKDRATSRIDGALQTLGERLKLLISQGRTASPEYALLAQQQSQLVLARQLTGGLTTVNEFAAAAGKVSPRPKRDAILAGLLGLVLGLGLAFLAEALDRRVISEHELEDEFQLPLLARIPKPSRELQKANDLIMVKAPGSAHAEMYRKLRTSLQFVNPDDSARTIMITSAVAQEGKSTTIANLAVALARANRRVVLVDLDLRAPILSKLFHVPGRPGITDIAVKRATLGDAIRPIPLTPVASPQTNGRHPATAKNGASEVEGLLHLLPAGTIPPSADEMLQNPRLLGLLDELATQFDVVLIDAPPLLAFGDAMTLSTKVDAILALTRLGRLERPVLHEFARQLQTLSARVLGYVITGVEHTDSYRYMYDAYAYEARSRGSGTKQRA